VRGAKAVSLGDAPAQCVVLVTKDLALRLAVFARPHHRHLGQPVLVVVAVVLLCVAADAFSDQPTEAVVVVALVLQHLDAVVLHPAPALAAEAAFFQRADAVTRQVVVEVFVALGLVRQRLRDAPALVVAVQGMPLLAVLHAGEFSVPVVAVAFEQHVFGVVPLLQALVPV